MSASVKYRVGKSKLAQALIVFFAFLITVPLIFIIIYIFREGITKINWDFLTKIPKPVGESGGGIVNALVGSIIIVMTAAVMAIPVGIMGGIYLSENQNQPPFLLEPPGCRCTAGRSIHCYRYRSLFLGRKTHWYFLCIFRKCCTRHHDATHPGPVDRRNAETDSVLIKRSRPGARASLSSGYSEGDRTLWCQRNSIGRYVIDRPYCRRNSASFIYRFWKSFPEYEPAQTDAESSAYDFQLCNQPL